MKTYKPGSHGQHLWGGDYWVASSGNVTDEAWVENIKKQGPPSAKLNLGLDTEHSRGLIKPETRSMEESWSCAFTSF